LLLQHAGRRKKNGRKKRVMLTLTRFAHTSLTGKMFEKMYYI
jgi:hypothetical protein